MYRGSRKHVLDWTGQPAFLAELSELIVPVPLRTSDGTVFMPQGHKAPSEARLDSFGPMWIPGSSAWSALESWWLEHISGANTPNWDIAVGCMIEERPGLVLVEAKANWRELSTSGKGKRKNASTNSHQNHNRIGAAISEACTGWWLLDERVTISRDSHYQLANRLAFTWKLAMLGFPVVLVYLGFTGDYGIRDAGSPFADEGDWQDAFSRYVNGALPLSLFDRRLNVGPSAVWLLSRSRPIIEKSTAPVSPKTRTQQERSVRS